MSKKNKIIIIISALSLAVITAVVLVLCLIVFKPDVGKKVTVLNSGEKVYVQADEAEDDCTYRFRFVNGSVEKIYDSSTRTLDITEQIWQGYIAVGQPYKISVCYVDNGGVLTGDYGEEISHTFSLQLGAPNVSLDGNILSWDAVRGAEFYTLRYTYGDQVISVTTDLLTFDLTTLHGGTRSVSVSSCSSNVNYRESASSKSFTVLISHALSEFISSSLNTQTYNLTITGKEYFESAVLVDESGNEYILNNLDCKKSGSNYVVNVNIRAYYKTNVNYYVKPLADAYNSFDGQATLIRI